MTGTEISSQTCKSHTCTHTLVQTVQESEEKHVTLLKVKPHGSWQHSPFPAFATPGGAKRPPDARSQAVTAHSGPKKGSGFCLLDLLWWAQSSRYIAGCLVPQHPERFTKYGQDGQEVIQHDMGSSKNKGILAGLNRRKQEFRLRMTSCEGRGSNLTETNGKHLKIKKKKCKSCTSWSPRQRPAAKGGRSPALGPCHCSALSCQPPALDQRSAKPPAAASVPRQAAPSSQARKRFVTSSSWLRFCRPQVCSACQHTLLSRILLFSGVMPDSLHPTEWPCL